MIKIFFGKLKGGSIQIGGPKDYRDEFLKMEGKECEIIFQGKEKLLSDKQMRYYRGVVVRLIAEKAGYVLHAGSKLGYEIAHQELAKKFLTFSVNLAQVKRNYVRSTTTLSSIEMTEYIEFCRQWALEKLNLVIPDPDPNYYGENILKRK